MVALEEMYQGLFDYDDTGYENAIDIRGRSQPRQNYPEQLYLIHDSLYSGYEAYDYQNPNLFASRNVITYSTLEPAYGIYSDTGVDILTNINRTVNTTLGK